MKKIVLNFWKMIIFSILIYAVHKIVHIFFAETNWDHIYSKFYSKFCFAGFADLPAAKGRYFAGAGGKRNYRQNGMYSCSNGMWATICVKSRGQHLRRLSNFKLL